MAANIEEMSQKLMSAVDVVMNAAADKQQRMEANQFCENFKESSPYCVQCGLYLSVKNNPAIARNFGLQLVEHCIKYRWNNLLDDEKQFIRENSMKLLASGTDHMLIEHVFIKNAISKIIVEIIKRQWPQEWPSLLNDLNELCKSGETQTELVLLILLRLTEDTVTFQNISTHRRRELHQALSQNVGGILSFFMDLLFNHTSKFLALENSNGTNEQMLIHCHMSQAVLATLTSFVDWVSFTHLWAREGILQTLCSLLTNYKLQLQAVECLLQIVSRKGKVEERKPFLTLFKKECMCHIYQAAGTASTSPVKEHSYVFLKRLCQVLVGIGSQLTVLWGAENGTNQPENFDVYLNAIFAFTCHPSQMLSSYTQSLWSSFFKHDFISHDLILQSFVPRVVQIAQIKLIKVGYPSRCDHSSCEYSGLDFDNDEDFNVFFSKYRTEIVDTLRLATVICPQTTFQLASNLLKEQLKKPVVVGDHSELGFCAISSPSFLEWEAVAVYLEGICSKILQSDKPKPSAEDGIILFKAVLSYRTEDPLILSCVLSCISALFVFLSLAQELLPTVLEKLFSVVTFCLAGQTKATRSRAVKNVRRHACSSLVKICKQYPNLLMSSFDQIYFRVKELSADSEQLSQMEKCTLLEALTLISNHFNNYAHQAGLLETNLAPIRAIWFSSEINYAFASAENFMAYIGLNQPPMEPGDGDLVGINRSQILYCTGTILGVLKRSKWPDDMDLAREGGFVQEFPPGSKNAVLRNPATRSILPLLENLFKLLKTINNLWTPEARAKVLPEYIRAYDMMDVDKNNALGIANPCVDATDLPAVKQPVERMQLFLTSIHDSCYHVLGNLGPSLGHEFYAMPGLGHYIITHTLCNIDLIPDYRLRSIIRVFMKPFVQFCPSDYYNVTLIPLLSQLCPYMFQRLNNKWMQLAQKSEINTESEDSLEAVQELLEDQVNRQISKEYIDLLSAILQANKRTTFVDVSDAMDEDEQPNSDSNQALGELGLHVLNQKILCNSIVSCCFRALSWNDTTICNKTLHLCSLLIKYLVSSQSLNSDDAKDLLICILMGLRQHGQHEANQNFLLNVGFQAYEALRPVHPEVMSVMLEIPDCPLAVLNNLDEVLLQTQPIKPVVEKKKKDMFKKVVFNIIGKNVGELFKKPVHMKSLPPLFRPSKPKLPNILDNDSQTGAFCRLFSIDGCIAD